jgi:hypothetical protein
VTFADVINEAEASKQGIFLFNQGRSWFKISGGQDGQDNGAAFNVSDPSHPLRLDGMGKWALSGVIGGNFKIIEKTGVGPMIVFDANTFTGKTVNVHAGTIHLGVMGAVNGATINVDADAAVVLEEIWDRVKNKFSVYGNESEIYSTNGTINLKDGAFVRVDPDGAKGLGSLKISGRCVVNFDKQYDAHDEMPEGDFSKSPAVQATEFDVAVTCINAPHQGIGSEWRGEPTEFAAKPAFSAVVLPAHGLFLGNGHRMTVQSDLGPVAGISLADKGKGLGLAPAAKVKEVRLATPHYLPLRVDCPVNLTADGTLVVGDAQKFHNLRSGGWAGQSIITASLDISQDGPVILTNANNVIGAIKVIAGTLAVSDAAALGGAKSIEVSDGGALKLSADAPIAIKGDLTLREGARLIVEFPDKLKPETLSGKTIVLATVAGKRTGDFALITSADPNWTVDARWEGGELQVVPQFKKGK